MKPRKRSPYTSGTGSILIEIKCKSAPITPEAQERARRRALRRKWEQQREPLPPPDSPSSDDNPPPKPE
jgi:hypothetical protein